LAGRLLSIIVNHNPDFKNQFEQFQNIIPQMRSIIITSTMHSMKVMVRMMVLVFLKAQRRPTIINTTMQSLKW